MANVKISNLPIETTLANMTGIAGYNASGTAQISGATIDSAFAKSNSNLQFIVDNGNDIDSNVGTGNIIFKNGASNTSTTVSVNSISSDTSFSIIGTTLNTNLTLTSGGELRITPNPSLGTPAVGDVLAAKNSLGDVEWVSNSGTTPGIGDVLNASQNTFSGQKINFIDGGTVAEISTVGIFAGGNFTIAQGGNDLLILGSASSPTNLLCGAGQISLGDTNNNINIATNGSDKIQLSCNGTGEVEFYLGSNNPGPAIGDVLTAKSTGGAVEWTTPSSGGGVEAFTSLTSADTITWDASVSTNAEIQLGNFLNVLNITNATSGMHFSLLIDASANDVLIFPSTFYGPSNLPNWIPSIPTADNYVIQFFYDGSNFFVTTEANTKEVLDIGNIVGNGLQLYFDAQTFQAAGSNSTWPSIGTSYGNTAVVTTGTAPTLNQETNVDPGTGQNVVNYYLTTNDQSMRTAIDPGSVMSTTNSYTQQAWVRITGVNTYNGITDFDPTESYSMYYEDTPSPGYIYMSETGSSTAGQGDMPANTGTSSADWVNVAITFNSTGVEATCEMNIYINGQLEDTVTGGMGTGPGSAGTSAYIDMLSSSSGTSIYGFEGDASIIMYYNRAISGTEVVANYDDQKGRFGLS